MILVTGGAGFIGSHLVDKLISDGFTVRVIDNESATENDAFYWNPEADNHKLDVANYEATRHLYDGIEVVYHLAAISRIQPAIASPHSVVETNIVGTENVLRCSAEAGVQRFVFSSSSSIYGNNDIPNVESQNADCLNAYSSSKLSGELMCNAMHGVSGMETISLRFFNVYGERQPLRGKYATVIGLFLLQAKRNLPLTIVGDGHQTRSFTHVSDVVDACYRAGFSVPWDGAFGDTYNVGYETSYSINDVAKMISDNTASIPERIGEARHTLSDSSKFKDVFGWKPNVSLEDWVAQNV
jgi:UDP-glucose 4-epimerase